MTYTAGLTHDPENAELKDGARRALDELKKTPMSDEAEDVLERAMSDPQLHAIMADPAMQQLVLDMQYNPAAAAARMKDPEVAAKMQKLADAGILNPGVM